jgi:hypothetical protein
MALLHAMTLALVVISLDVDLEVEGHVNKTSCSHIINLKLEKLGRSTLHMWWCFEPPTSKFRDCASCLDGEQERYEGSY